MHSEIGRRGLCGRAARAAAALALAAAMLVPAAEADTVTPREVKPTTVTPRVITPAPTPQPESTPPPAGPDFVVGATRFPEASLLPERVRSTPNPVPMPNVTPVPSLRAEGDLGAGIADLLMIVGAGEEWLYNPQGPLFIPATMLAQSDNPSEPNPLVDVPTETNLLPIPRALRSIAGVSLVEAALAAASKSLADAKCGDRRVDDNGVSYCPK